jgi:hypothetical protein
MVTEQLAQMLLVMIQKLENVYCIVGLIKELSGQNVESVSWVFLSKNNKVL